MIQNTEYAGRGVGNAGLTLGCISTGILTAGALGAGNGGGGILGNLFGGGNNNVQQNQIIALTAQVSKLEAEKYSDNASNAQSDRLLSVYINPMATTMASMQTTIATLQAEIECLKKTQALEMEVMRKDVQLVRQELNCCCTQVATSVANVNAILSGVTKTVIPNTAICDMTTTSTAA